MLDKLLKYSIITSIIIIIGAVYIFGDLIKPFIPFLNEDVVGGNYPFIVIDENDRTVRSLSKKEIMIITDSNHYLDDGMKRVVRNLNNQTVPVRVMVRSDGAKRSDTLRFFKDIRLRPLFSPKHDDFHNSLPVVYILSDEGEILFNKRLTTVNYYTILTAITKEFNVIDFRELEKYGVSPSHNSKLKAIDRIRIFTNNLRGVNTNPVIVKQEPTPKTIEINLPSIKEGEQELLDRLNGVEDQIDEEALDVEELQEELNIEDSGEIQDTPSTLPKPKVPAVINEESVSNPGRQEINNSPERFSTWEVLPRLEDVEKYEDIEEDVLNDEEVGEDEDSDVQYNN